MAISSDAVVMLQRTSRTFYDPIMALPAGLCEGVAAGYLCLRAIDEIEDNPHWTSAVKATMLRAVSAALQTRSGGEDIDGALTVDSLTLPDVTAGLKAWLELAPHEVRPRVWETTAAMADRMAFWCESQWAIRSPSDLDQYTFDVAGAVGLLLSDLWAWYDGTHTSHQLAVAFGRGLQSLNILLNRHSDLARGVDFFPQGWLASDMMAYTRVHLLDADEYCRHLNSGPVKDFCVSPLTLAWASLDAIAAGRDKLSRGEVRALWALQTQAEAG